MSWIKDIFAPDERKWEEFYRNRWSYDRIVRSTHGVNCTGSCSWNVYVKNGIVTWEMQALDYPVLDRESPPYEPRGCQRGISYSWYIYSPLRVKYPLVRGALVDLWRKAKSRHPDDPVAAWRDVVSDPESRARYQRARGKGGFRRSSWEEVYEIMAAANVHTILEHGPDRVVGFSPIPAMSMVSYAGGARLMQLMGGVCLSFYDWYCDLPPASPEIWGEQTDVAESADWYNSKFIAVVGSNVLMTRTPDAHFLVEARHKGAKVVVFSPDFNQTAKVADEWIPLHQGQDSAFWMAVGHVILKECYADRQVPYFLDYVKKYSDAPFLVELEPEAGSTGGESRQSAGTEASALGTGRGSARPAGARAGVTELRHAGAAAPGTESPAPGGEQVYTPGRLLRAARVEATSGVENAEWKTFVVDRATGELRLPKGTVGHRWQKKKGEWNLELEDADGAPIDPALFVEDGEPLAIRFPDFTDGAAGESLTRRVAARRVETVDGPVYVTTVLELLMAQYGVARGAEAGGEWPADYDDDSSPYTPAWQERFTGVKASEVVTFARQWARTAELSGGKCSVIIGAGVNHWYHNNLIYRAAIMPLILCGCVGVNGGGWNHYVGQEKLAPQASWAPIAFATDWGGPPRLMNSPSFHYIHSGQWRYDKSFDEVCAVSDATHAMSGGHTIDKNILAVRNGWLPCFPQFDRSSLEVVREAEAAGAATDEEIVAYVVDRLRDGSLKFSIEDPDAPSSYPRVWYIWRGNALQSSAKGHEYFLKHYLGTHTNAIAEEVARDHVRDAVWRDEAATGKLDLVVDLNFRMDTSALYSDIVLPAATYYEKNDLNSTDLHTFIHPLQAAVPPCWESKSDWDAFRGLAAATARLAARYLPDPVKDVVVTPLMHDTPAEMAQPSVRDWSRGECEPVPGKTMPNLKVVVRDYPSLYNRFVSLGPQFRDNGLAVHGTHYDVDDAYDDYVRTHPTERWGGATYPSLKEDVAVCDAILHFAAETNGEMAYRAFAAESAKTGIDHTHLAADTRSVRYTFEDLCVQPRRYLTTPYWTGNTNRGRAYSAFCQNVEERIPWRTLTGRQHLYLDHEVYRAFGEHLPTHKPRPDALALRDLVRTEVDGASLVLNYLTPHGKWHIHSTYGDTLRMETLSRGVEPFWMNDRDAAVAGIEDNDWVEVVNDHGVVCTRACVSARIPRGMGMIYHATERTISVPKSRSRGGRRAGAHNSLTRVRLKPLFMIGGYAQFSYAFNYWGPTGVNRDTYVVVRKLGKVVW